MQDSVNTVIHDTVHTMSFDTIHTVAYDTVHTTVFDTVRVVLDSSFTPQLLRDSQAFYSSAFGDLLTVFVWISGIFTFAVSVVFAYKIYVEKTAIKKAVKEANEKADEEIEKRLDALSKNIFNLRESVYTSFFAQAKQSEYDFKARVSLLTIILSDISLHFDKVFLVQAFTAIEILSEIIETAVNMGTPEKIIHAILTYVEAIEKFTKEIQVSTNVEEAKKELDNAKRTLDAIEKIKPVLMKYCKQH